MNCVFWVTSLARTFYTLWQKNMRIIFPGQCGFLTFTDYPVFHVSTARVVLPRSLVAFQKVPDSKRTIYFKRPYFTIIPQRIWLYYGPDEIVHELSLPLNAIDSSLWTIMNFHVVHHKECHCIMLCQNISPLVMHGMAKTDSEKHKMIGCWHLIGVDRTCLAHTNTFIWKNSINSPNYVTWEFSSDFKPPWEKENCLRAINSTCKLCIDAHL